MIICKNSLQHRHILGEKLYIFLKNLFATFLNAELFLGFCSSSRQECNEATDGGATVWRQANSCQGLLFIKHVLRLLNFSGAVLSSFFEMAILFAEVFFLIPTPAPVN